MSVLLRIVPVMFALMACTPTAEPPPEPLPPTGSCGAVGLQGLLGQPDTVLRTMKFAGPTRISYPGQAVTMDYSDSRLNITINTGNRIEAVTCG